MVARRMIAWIAAGTAFLAGCSNDPGFAGVPTVRDAEQGEIAACRYVADLSIKPSLYGPFADAAVKYARNKLKEDAANMGANTVVFQKVDPGAMVTDLKATAYKC